MSSEVATLRVRPSRLRCPFCHADVAEAQGTLCSTCLARHHSGCWEELGACASCQERSSDSDVSQVEISSDVPRVRVEIEEAPWKLTRQGTVVVLARPDRWIEAVELELVNRTPWRRRVRLREVPSWVEPSESGWVVPAGGSRVVRFECRLWQTHRVGFDTVSERTRWLVKHSGGLSGQITRGTMVVVVDDDAMTLTLELVHPFPAVARGLIAAALATVFPLGYVVWASTWDEVPEALGSGRQVDRVLGRRWVQLQGLVEKELGQALVVVGVVAAVALVFGVLAILGVTP